ncbi:hypothetical protein J6TS1_09650 [Siminovitchia terrae]|uniref:Uncharacterized protein n=1 Tax=Siminovitchia terrae TaxID=1914933 RepID=A0ABQ4KSS2_SIMTE|nr:hypothetical protein [Siminovitchia terrae]GIN89026.1 hypothetical protein J22TS1_00770 [Siminovitchia terrae]GIN95095.1 hypothetical protein J6TS1_09650 [Siminovitchia terrae]
MTIAFQIVLLCVIVISFLGVMGSNNDMLLQDRLMGAFYASLVAFIVRVVWL